MGLSIGFGQLSCLGSRLLTLNQSTMKTKPKTGEGRLISLGRCVVGSGILVYHSLLLLASESPSTNTFCHHIHIIESQYYMFTSTSGLGTKTFA